MRPKPGFLTRFLAVLTAFSLLVDPAAAVAVSSPAPIQPSTSFASSIFAAESFSAVAGPFTHPPISRRITSGFWQRTPLLPIRRTPSRRDLKAELPADVARHYQRIAAELADYIQAKLPSNGIVVVDGLPGVGKSTLVHFLREILESRGRSSMELDQGAFIDEPKRWDIVQQIVDQSLIITDHFSRIYRADLLESVIAQLARYVRDSSPDRPSLRLRIPHAYVRGIGEVPYQDISIGNHQWLFMVGGFTLESAILRNLDYPILRIRLKDDPYLILDRYERRSLQDYPDPSAVRLRMDYYLRAILPSVFFLQKHTQDIVDVDVLLGSKPAAWKVRFHERLRPSTPASNPNRDEPKRGYWTVQDGPNRRNQGDSRQGDWAAPNLERRGFHGVGGIPGHVRRNDDAQEKSHRTSPAAAPETSSSAVQRGVGHKIMLTAVLLLSVIVPARPLYNDFDDHPDVIQVKRVMDLIYDNAFGPVPRFSEIEKVPDALKVIWTLEDPVVDTLIYDRLRHYRGSPYLKENIQGWLFMLLGSRVQPAWVEGLIDQLGASRADDRAIAVQLLGQWARKEPQTILNHLQSKGVVAPVRQVLPAARDLRKKVRVVIPGYYFQQDKHDNLVLRTVKSKLPPNSTVTVVPNLGIPSVRDIENALDAYPDTSFIYNFSLGTLSPDPRLISGRWAPADIERLGRRGVIFIFAAGNDNELSLWKTPAFDNVIYVADADVTDRLKAPKSNFGLPGYLLGAVSPVMIPGRSAPLLGTSYAAPVVAGNIARLLEEHPEMPEREAIERYASQARPMPEEKFFQLGLLGRGLLPQTLEAAPRRPAQAPRNGGIGRPRGYWTVQDGPSRRNQGDPRQGDWVAPNLERRGFHGMAGVPHQVWRNDDAQAKPRRAARASAADKTNDPDFRLLTTNEIESKSLEELGDLLAAATQEWIQANQRLTDAQKRLEDLTPEDIYRAVTRVPEHQWPLITDAKVQLSKARRHLDDVTRYAKSIRLLIRSRQMATPGAERIEFSGRSRGEPITRKEGAVVAREVVPAQLYRLKAEGIPTARRIRERFGLDDVPGIPLELFDSFLDEMIGNAAIRGKSQSLIISLVELAAGERTEPERGFELTLKQDTSGEDAWRRLCANKKGFDSRGADYLFDHQTREVDDAQVNMGAGLESFGDLLRAGLPARLTYTRHPEDGALSTVLRWTVRSPASAPESVFRVNLDPFGAPDFDLQFENPGHRRDPLDASRYVVRFMHEQQEVGSASGMIGSNISVNHIGAKTTHTGVGAAFLRWLTWQAHRRRKTVYIHDTTASVLMACRKAGLALDLDGISVSPDDTDQEFFRKIGQHPPRIRDGWDITARWPDPEAITYTPIRPIGRRSRQTVSGLPGSAPTANPNRDEPKRGKWTVQDGRGRGRRNHGDPREGDWVAPNLERRGFHGMAGISGHYRGNLDAQEKQRQASGLIGTRRDPQAITREEFEAWTHQVLAEIGSQAAEYKNTHSDAGEVYDQFALLYNDLNSLLHLLGAPKRAIPADEFWSVAQIELYRSFARQRDENQELFRFQSINSVLIFLTLIIMHGKAMAKEYQAAADEGLEGPGELWMSEERNKIGIGTARNSAERVIVPQISKNYGLQYSELDRLLTAFKALRQEGKFLSRAALFQTLPDDTDSIAHQIKLAFAKSLEGTALHALPSDDALESLGKGMTDRALQSRLDAALLALTPREEDVLNRMYGRNGFDEYTQEELGMNYGVTKERMRQIYEKALRKLRHPSRSTPLHPFIEPSSSPPNVKTAEPVDSRVRGKAVLEVLRLLRIRYTRDLSHFLRMEDGALLEMYPYTLDPDTLRRIRAAVPRDILDRAPGSLLEQITSNQQTPANPPSFLVKSPEAYTVGSSRWENVRGPLMAHLETYLRPAGLALSAGARQALQAAYASTAWQGLSPYQIEEIVYEFIRQELYDVSPLAWFRERAYRAAADVEIPWIESQLKDLDALKEGQVAIHLAVAGNRVTSEGLREAARRGEQGLIQYAKTLRTIPTLSQDNTRQLLSELSGSPKRILYLLDNTVENVYDLALIRWILKQGHHITLVTKTAEADIKVTRQDMATFASLFWFSSASRFFEPVIHRSLSCEVIDSGSASRGTDLRRATPEFQAAWKDADVVIVKGEENRATLITPAGLRRGFYSLAVGKYLAESGIPLGTGVVDLIPAFESSPRDRQRRRASPSGKTAALNIDKAERGYWTVQDGRSRRNQGDPRQGDWVAPNEERRGYHGMAGMPGQVRRGDDAQAKPRRTSPSAPSPKPTPEFRMLSDAEIQSKTLEELGGIMAEVTRQWTLAKKRVAEAQARLSRVIPEQDYRLASKVPEQMWPVISDARSELSKVFTHLEDVTRYSKSIRLRMIALRSAEGPGLELPSAPVADPLRDVVSPMAQVSGAGSREIHSTDELIALFSERLLEAIQQHDQGRVNQIERQLDRVFRWLFPASMRKAVQDGRSPEATDELKEVAREFGIHFVSLMAFYRGGPFLTAAASKALGYFRFQIFNRPGTVQIAVYDDEASTPHGPGSVIEEGSSATHDARVLLPLLNSETKDRLSQGDILLVGPGRRIDEILHLLELFPNLNSLTVVDASWNNLVSIKQQLDAIPSLDKSKITLYPCRDLARLPFDPARFDAAYANSVYDKTIAPAGLDSLRGLHILGEWARELRRVLKPRGVYLTNLSNREFFIGAGFQVRGVDARSDIHQFVAVADQSVLSSPEPSSVSGSSESSVSGNVSESGAVVDAVALGKIFTRLLELDSVRLSDTQRPTHQIRQIDLMDIVSPLDVLPEETNHRIHVQHDSELGVVLEDGTDEFGWIVGDLDQKAAIDSVGHFSCHGISVRARKDNQWVIGHLHIYPSRYEAQAGHKAYLEYQWLLNHLANPEQGLYDIQMTLNIDYRWNGFPEGMTLERLIREAQSRHIRVVHSFVRPSVHEETRILVTPSYVAHQMKHANGAISYDSFSWGDRTSLASPVGSPASGPGSVRTSADLIRVMRAPLQELVDVLARHHANKIQERIRQKSAVATSAAAPAVNPTDKSNNPRDRHWPGMNAPGKFGDPGSIQDRLAGAVRSEDLIFQSEDQLLSVNLPSEQKESLPGMANDVSRYFYRGMRLAPKELLSILRDGMRISQANGGVIDVAQTSRWALRFALWPLGNAPQHDFLCVLFQMDRVQLGQEYIGAFGLQKIHSDVPPSAIHKVFALKRDGSFVELSALLTRATPELSPSVDPAEKSNDPRDRHGYQIVRLDRAFAERHRAALVDLVRLVHGSERTEEYVFRLPPGAWELSVAAVDSRGQLAGILIAFPQDAQTMYGWRLCVVPEHRRNRLALLLLRRFLSTVEASQKGLAFTLQTDAANPEALYQAIGIPIRQTLLVADREEVVYSAPVSQWLEGVERLLARAAAGTPGSAPAAEPGSGTTMGMDFGVGSLLMRGWRLLAQMTHFRWVARSLIVVLISLAPWGFDAAVNAAADLASSAARRPYPVADSQAPPTFAYYPPEIQMLLSGIREADPVFYEESVKDPIYVQWLQPSLFNPNEAITLASTRSPTLGDPVIQLNRELNAEPNNTLRSLKHERTHIAQYRKFGVVSGLVGYITRRHSLAINSIRNEVEAFQNSGEAIDRVLMAFYLRRQAGKVVNILTIDMSGILFAFVAVFGMYLRGLSKDGPTESGHVLASRAA